MLLYYLFWMITGFILHFYTIFGTNLLTGGPAQIATFFCLFQCFAEMEYQTESKQNETFARIVFLEQTQSRRLGVDVKKQPRRPRGCKAGPRWVGAPPTLVGPSWLPWPTSFAYIYSHNLKTSRSTMKTYFHRRNLLYPWDPILGPFSVLYRRENRSRRASTSTP